MNGNSAFKATRKKLLSLPKWKKNVYLKRFVYFTKTSTWTLLIYPQLTISCKKHIPLSLSQCRALYGNSSFGLELMNGFLWYYTPILFTNNSELYVSFQQRNEIIRNQHFFSIFRIRNSKWNFLFFNLKLVTRSETF